MTTPTAGAFDKRAYYDEIADVYGDHVVSPYELGVELPLRSDIERWLEGAGRDALAADFGCGSGQALEMIAGRAGLTLGLDFSLGMLASARRRLRRAGIRRVGDKPLRPPQVHRELRTRDRGRTRLVEADLHALEWLRGRVDFAIASNSITDESAAASEHMFDQVAACLAPGGSLVAMFPSWDATTYALELHRRLGDDEPDSLGELDAEGVYTFEGLRQKFWSPDELRAACVRNGLVEVELVKIHFPWSAMAECGWGDFEGQPEMWDWYLRARRPDGDAPHPG